MRYSTTVERDGIALLLTNQTQISHSNPGFWPTNIASMNVLRLHFAERSCLSAVMRSQRRLTLLRTCSLQRVARQKASKRSGSSLYHINAQKELSTAQVTSRSNVHGHTAKTTAASQKVQTPLPCVSAVAR